MHLDGQRGTQGHAEPAFITDVAVNRGNAKLAGKRHEEEYNDA